MTSCLKEFDSVLFYLAWTYYYSLLGASALVTHHFVVVGGPHYGSPELSSCPKKAIYAQIIHYTLGAVDNLIWML